jgi:AcrR family transcriptional regulator
VKRQRSRGISRSAILDVTRRLYAATDYTAVTVREIAKKLGCRSASLYHYFDSKNEIFRALVDQGLELFARYKPVAPSTEPLEQLRWRFWRYYTFSKTHPEYFALLFIDRPSPAADQLHDHKSLSGTETARCVEACLNAGLFPQGTDPREAIPVLLCAVHGAATIGLRHDRFPKFPVDAAAARALDLAIAGIRAGLLQNRIRSSSGRLSRARKMPVIRKKSIHRRGHAI